MDNTINQVIEGNNTAIDQIRENYETFFNTIDEFLFVLDENGNIIHYNTTVINRLGYEENELIGKSVLMLHPPERRNEASIVVNEMLYDAKIFCPVPILTKDGHQIPVETRVSRGIWNGKPALFGISKDISRLTLSEEKFSKVFYMNPSACGLSDVATGKYVEVNDAFFKLLEFNKDEVIGRSVVDLGILKPEQISELYEIIGDKKEIINLETILTTKHGKTKHVLLSAEYIYVQNKKYRFTVVNDITDRKHAEDALLESKLNLQKISNEKDKFFSIIAHDLRSPFNGFLGLSKMLVDELESLSSDEIKDFAKAIRLSADKMFILLENLLHWSMAKQGMIPFHPEENLLFPMVDAIEFGKVKNITLVNKVPENLNVFADKNMLQSIIRNLLSNAVKFTPRNGKITINASKSDHYVELIIKDTGIGMSNKIVNNLFRLDGQVNRKGTEGEPSSGLGLLLCKEFIDKHNGKIWVKSKVDSGSTFHIEFPKQQKL